MIKTNSRTPNRLVELTIDSLSFGGGRGVGRVDGIVTFVPDAAPGDRVRARLTTIKPKFQEAELVEVLAPSPDRRVPPCPVADRCGGCAWQHVTYAAQVRQKEKILVDALRRVPTEILPFLPAPAEFGYRNRVQLQLSDGAWGFFAARTRELVQFERCLIAEDAINDEIARHRPSEFPGASKVEFALSDSGVRVMPNRRDPEAALFSQVNTAQNEALKSLVTSWSSTDVDWFMDLYAGDGNLTAPLAAHVPRAFAIAIELSRTSVERGRLAHPNVEWVAGDVGRTLAELKPRNGRGLVVLDPPRVGVERDVIAGLIAHAPVQIIYVSCNPSTFARDAERLVAGGDYRLAQVRGLDMFPQTEHVELIARFERR